MNQTGDPDCLLSLVPLRPKPLAGLGRQRRRPVPHPPRQPGPPHPLLDSSTELAERPQPVRPYPAHSPGPGPRPLPLHPAQHLRRLPAAANRGPARQPAGGGRGDGGPASPSVHRRLAE
jgi:hypothetical protein